MAKRSLEDITSELESARRAFGSPVIRLPESEAVRRRRLADRLEADFREEVQQAEASRSRKRRAEREGEDLIGFEHQDDEAHSAKIRNVELEDEEEEVLPYPGDVEMEDEFLPYPGSAATVVEGISRRGSPSDSVMYSRSPVPVGSKRGRNSADVEYSGSPARQRGRPASRRYGIPARGMSPVDESINIAAEDVPREVDEGAFRQAVENKTMMLSYKGKDGPPVGMAQRIKYKVLRKAQGLLSAFDRVANKPTQQELRMVVHPRGGHRMTLQDNRKLQIIREIENLKADVRADGFANFLTDTINFNPAHYHKNPINPINFDKWVRTPPKLTHYERSGITNQYSGNQRKWTPGLH
jgi:hypothetical protein